MQEQVLNRIAEATAYDASGDKVGAVHQIYLDDQTSEPTLVSVKTGLFGTSESLVPLQGFRMDEDKLILNYSKDVIKDAPRVEADAHISQSEQEQLWDYYEGSFSTSGSDRDNLVGDQSNANIHNGDADLATVTRSEERLNVGKESVETGRIRLRKYTTTEEQNLSVPVTKEKLVIERTPVSGQTHGNIDADAADQVEEVVLREERAVVNKETVAVEEVKLGKESVTEQAQISEQVRKEHVDLETDGDVDQKHLR